jgi:hypothetical protein
MIPKGPEGLFISLVSLYRKKPTQANFQTCFHHPSTYPSVAAMVKPLAILDALKADALGSNLDSEGLISGPYAHRVNFHSELQSLSPPNEANRFFSFVLSRTNPISRGRQRSSAPLLCVLAGDFSVHQAPLSRPPQPSPSVRPDRRWDSSRQERIKPAAGCRTPAGGRPHPSEGCWQDFLPLAGDAGSRTSSTEATRSEEVKLFFLLLFSLGNSQMKWTSLAVRRNSHAVIELKDV